MAKLLVDAAVQWGLQRPVLIVSVQSDTGLPIQGLFEPHFQIGRMGRGNQWLGPLTRTNFDFHGGSRGFYHILILSDMFDTPWQEASTTLVFTVEVTHGDDRGQCLAINSCCERDWLGGFKKKSSETATEMIKIGFVAAMSCALVWMVARRYAEKEKLLLKSRP